MKETMNPNKALWEKGDFTRIAASMRESGEALVKRIGVGQGMRVLDLGCGDGTTALPAAQLGADVLGVDIARNLVDTGNRRVVELGIANCKFYGPTMNAFDAAEKNGRSADLQRELEDLFASQNQSPDKDAIAISATFLRVTVEV